MEYLGAIMSLFFIGFAGILLLKSYNPHAVLLISGLLMLILAQFLNYNLPILKVPTLITLIIYFHFTIKKIF